MYRLGGSSIKNIKPCLTELQKALERIENETDEIPQYVQHCLIMNVHRKHRGGGRGGIHVFVFFA
jgi:mevalonate kinase